jgi:hypothetical protein
VNGGAEAQQAGPRGRLQSEPSSLGQGEREQLGFDDRTAFPTLKASRGTEAKDAANRRAQQCRVEPVDT